jgi:cyclic-di-GMP-binding protein
MESLRLTIPSQQEGQHILVETNHAKLSEWLHSLPLADMSKALPEITRAISSLNRTELGFKQRSELIELFDSSYQLIHDYYRPKRSGIIKNSILEAQNIEKLHNLTREMAFAHKIIVHDSQHKRQIWGKNRIKTRAIGFSIYYLGMMLIEQYENYNPIPMYLWREINALFATAGKFELQNEKIVTSAKCNCLETIEQNYIRNCLTALSDPYHLDKGEHWQVFYYLQNWIHLARISEDPDDFRIDECFIIDVTSENKPNFVTSELDDPEDPKIRLLLTFDLIRQITFDIEKFEETNRLPENSFHRSISFSSAKSLWPHLKTHWTQRIERASRRYPIVTKVDIVWGINDVCRILGRTEQNGKTPLSFDEIKALTDLKQVEQLTWDATNVSNGGIGLCSRHYMVPQISLGNIALIREYMDRKPAPRWRLAVCCWLTGDKHNGTMLGLKYIDGKYNPVRLVLHQGKNAKGGQAGIVVSDTIVDGSNSSTIITSKGSSQGDRVYAMLGIDKPVEVRPRVKVEVTPCIERFFFQTYELRQELAEEFQDDESGVVPWTAIPSSGDIGNELNSEDQDSNAINLDTLRLPGDH